MAGEKPREGADRGRRLSRREGLSFHASLGFTPKTTGEVDAFCDQKGMHVEPWGKKKMLPTWEAERQLGIDPKAHRDRRYI